MRRFGVPLLFDKNSIIEIIGAHPESIRRIWIEKGHERSFQDVLNAARVCGVQFKIIPKEDFRRRVREPKTHLCAERDDYPLADPVAILAEMEELPSCLICALDGIFDPHNFGNILRSAACFGVDAIVIPQDKSCGITDTVVRISRGGIEHVKIVRVVNLSRFLEDVKKRGFFCYGFDEGGETPITAADLRDRTCLVFGSEEGMRRLTKATCDRIVRIPVGKDFSTLNVATSCAVAFYEVQRQRIGTR